MTELTVEGNYYNINLVFIMQKGLDRLQFWSISMVRICIAIFVTFILLETEAMAFNFIAPAVEGNQFFRSFIIIVLAVSAQLILLAVRKYDFTLETCFLILGISAIVFSRLLTLVSYEFGSMLLVTGMISVFLFACSLFQRLFCVKGYG